MKPQTKYETWKGVSHLTSPRTEIRYHWEEFPWPTRRDSMVCTLLLQQSTELEKLHMKLTAWGKACCQNLTCNSELHLALELYYCRIRGTGKEECSRVLYPTSTYAHWFLMNHWITPHPVTLWFLEKTFQSAHTHAYSWQKTVEQMPRKWYTELQTFCR